MNNVGNYNFEAELNLSSELSSDDFQFDHLFSNDEYCEINIDLFDGDVLETFGPELDDNDDFESLFFPSLEPEAPNEITIKEEDASSTNSSLSDQQNSSPNSKLSDVHSLETTEAKNLPLPFIKPTPEFGTVGGDLNNNSNCFTETVIKQEVKEDECHFVPNLYERFGRVSAKDHKEISTLKSTSAEFCSGNIADLVKTRKRTCNNGKAKIDTNANLKSKNHTTHKKEQASNKNCAAKSATIVPDLPSKNRPANASDIPLFPVIKIKREPEENFQLFESIKYQDSKDSKSSCSTVHEPSNRQQNIPGKNNILPSSRKRKTKKRKKHLVPESTNHAATIVPECKTFNCGYPPNSRKHTFPSPNPKCSPELNQTFVSFDFTPIPQSPNSPNSKTETVNKLISACSRLSDKNKISSVHSSPTENTKSSRQVESPSLLKLRISRCANQNQFKSYVVPAEPIPVYTVQSGLTNSGDHSVAGKHVKLCSEEISHTLQGLKMEPLSDTDKNELYSEKRNKDGKAIRISKIKEKKKRRKVGKHKDCLQNTKPNKPITCDPNKSANMVESIHPNEVKTISDGSAQANLIFSIKREIEDISETKLTEVQDRVLGGDIGIQLQDEIPVNQQSNVVNNENFSCEKSQHETRENFFPKARKKLKTNTEGNISEYKTSNNDNQRDSDMVTMSLGCTANIISEIKSCSIAETIPVVKIKQEPVDTYEYSEFEMHQSIEVPLDDLNVTSPLDCQDFKCFGSKALEKSTSLSCSEKHDQAAIAHKEFDFNDVVKSERASYEKHASSDSVPSSPNIGSNSNNEQSYVSITTSTYHVPPPSPFSMSKDIFETSQSSCDSDSGNENYKDDLVPFIKIADSQGSLTSSQGTIVNNENCFQESRTADKSNDVGTKNNFFNSPSFSSSFGTRKTEQIKSPAPATSPEQNTFAVETPYPSVCNSPIESTSIQRDSITPKIPHCENKSTLISPKPNSPQSDEAKCTDAKAVDLQQHSQPNNEAMPSANSAFFIATMQNSFRFRIGKQSAEEAPKQTTAIDKGNSSRDNSSECSSIEHKKLPRSTKSNARQYRSRKRSRSSSSGSSDSFYDYKASKRVKKYHISRRKEILESSRKKSSYSKYHNSSSRSSYNESKSSYSESRSSYSESRSSRHSYSSTYEERSRSPIESFRKTEPRKRYSHRSRSRHRRHRSSSRSRSRSPDPKCRRGSSYDRPRSISSSKRNMAEEQEKQTDERRVVYVGQIPDGFTTSDLRERFSRFGRIEDINIHRRNANRNNNFGFVTFKHTEDACDAIARGNDPPMKPKFDISFGGRRLFCRQRYSDLDKEKELMENNGYYYVPSSKANDFDSLLNAELRRTGLHDKK